MLWSIVALESHPEYDGLQNVVHTAQWLLSNGSSYITGPTVIPFHSQETFIVFENLTEQVVLDWVKLVMGQEDIDQYEADFIAGLVDGTENPPAADASLPWYVS